MARTTFFASDAPSSDPAFDFDLSCDYLYQDVLADTHQYVVYYSLLVPGLMPVPTCYCRLLLVSIVLPVTVGYY